MIDEGELHVGVATVVESRSPLWPVGTIFEDDGETGYFYALDLQSNDTPIIDAMHIYDVASVADKEAASFIEIRWSSDGLKSGVLINAHLHALFDFLERRGYCRTNSDAWSDSVANLLR